MTAIAGAALGTIVGASRRPCPARKGVPTGHGPHPPPSLDPVDETCALLDNSGTYALLVPGDPPGPHKRRRRIESAGVQSQPTYRASRKVARARVLRSAKVQSVGFTNPPKRRLGMGYGLGVIPMPTSL